MSLSEKFKKKYIFQQIMDLLSCHVMCVRRDFYSMIMNIESRRSNTKSTKRNGHFIVT